MENVRQPEDLLQEMGDSLHDASFKAVMAKNKCAFLKDALLGISETNAEVGADPDFWQGLSNVVGDMESAFGEFYDVAEETGLVIYQITEGVGEETFLKRKLAEAENRGKEKAKGEEFSSNLQGMTEAVKKGFNAGKFFEDLLNGKCKGVKPYWNGDPESLSSGKTS